MVRTWVWTDYEGWWRMFVSTFFLENSTHRLDFSFNRPPSRHSRSRLDTIAKKAADILNRNLFLRKPFMALVPLGVHTLCGATAATSVQRATRRVLLLLLSSTISSDTRPPARHRNLQMELCTLTSVASVVPAHLPPKICCTWCCFCSPLHSLCIFAVCSNLFVCEQFYPLLVVLYKTFKKKTKKNTLFFSFYIADIGYNI